jgi:competence protein CoiA
MEVPAADGSWGADVLASDPSGTWTMALEAQLSPITEADIRVRTERMQSDQVGVCWFSDRPKPPWLGVVPSVRLTQSDDDRRLLVAEGLYRFSLPCWQGVPNVPLIEFLRWVFTGKAVPHEPRIHRGRPRPTEWIWTAAQYVQAEDAQLAELAAAERDRQAAKAEQARKLAGIHAQNAISRADVLQEATAVEAITRDVPGTGRRREKVLALRPMLNEALTLLTSKYGIDATLGWDLHNRRRYALGDPLVNSDGVPVAVFGPVPELVRGPAFLLLAGLLLLFPTSEQHDRFVKAMRKAKRTPAEEFRTDFLT